MHCELRDLIQTDVFLHHVQLITLYLPQVDSNHIPRTSQDNQYKQDAPELNLECQGSEYLAKSDFE